MFKLPLKYGCSIGLKFTAPAIVAGAVLDCFTFTPVVIRTS